MTRPLTKASFHAGVFLSRLLPGGLLLLAFCAGASHASAQGAVEWTSVIGARVEGSFASVRAARRARATTSPDGIGSGPRAIAGRRPAGTGSGSTAPPGAAAYSSRMNFLGFCGMPLTRTS